MNRWRNCSWCRFQIMSPTWTSKFRGLTVPTMVPGIHLAPLPKLHTKTAWFGVNWGLLSRLSWKTLTSCFELLALSALNLILGCLFISNSGENFFNAVGVFFYFEHTNNYNILHLQFITGNCYRLQKRNKKKKKDKVHKNTIVYILTIKRRLPVLWSSITHLPICQLHFN